MTSQEAIDAISEVSPESIPEDEGEPTLEAAAPAEEPVVKTAPKNSIFKFAAGNK